MAAADEPAIDPVTIGDLTASHLPAAVALSTAVGWPHRMEDWAFVHALGHGLAAEAEGALVGTALGWEFGPAVGTLGMVITAPPMQGLGIGRRMLNRVLQQLGPRTVILHATEAGMPLYRSLGFVSDGIVVTHQHGPVATGPKPLHEERIRAAGPCDFTALAALDRAATGMQRLHVIRALQPVSNLVVLDRGGEAVGFAIRRRFGLGHVIGPVVAPDAASARALIGHLLAPCAGGVVRIDVPAHCDLSPWLASIGLPETGRVVRMVRGPAPATGSMATCFALISQALN